MSKGHPQTLKPVRSTEEAQELANKRKPVPEKVKTYSVQLLPSKVAELERRGHKTSSLLRKLLDDFLTEETKQSKSR